MIMAGGAFMEFIDVYITNFFQDFDLLFRIFLSAILGFFIGLDRTHKNKPAGVKTYTFVTTACSLITIVSIQSVGVYSHLHENTMMDPMRLTAQIVTGLGFIGAGLILKNGVRVVGLTSAAMIFFAGGVGIGIGAGFYSIVLFTMIIAFLFVPFGNWIEMRENNKLEKDESEVN
jgi:putative Mg2+ transporter-C (MgtC) family protein